MTVRRKKWHEENGQIAGSIWLPEIWERVQSAKWRISFWQSVCLCTVCCADLLNLLLLVVEAPAVWKAFACTELFEEKINHAAVWFQYIFLQCLLTITRIYFPLVWIFIWLQNKSLNRNHRSFIGTLHHKKTDHRKIISSFIRVSVGQYQVTLLHYTNKYIVFPQTGKF